MYYKFKNELKEAVIIKRPNRFIMHILINGKIEKAHCPVTGKIGNFSFLETPCLVSVSDSKTRKTKFTVEAISPQKVSAKRKTWIGINQGKSNAYVEFFLKNDFFSKMIKIDNEVTREKKLGNSRIDFKVGNNFIEVKTFLHALPFGDLSKTESNVNSLERLIKHFSDLACFAKKENGKAIVLITNQYNAKEFIPPENARNTKIGKTVRKAMKNGVENWQVNLKITRKGVHFIDYFKLDFEI